jgi:uncharacterized membrane protein YgcG
MKLSRHFVLTGLAAALTVAQAQMAAQTTAAPAAAATAAVAPAPAETAKPAFSQAQIDQMVAPIALYPDALLAQVFMSVTYPLEIVQAARWVKKNESLKGEALDTALREQPWDPSVKTLVMFPSVLQRMNENLDWTQDLGDAFLAQEQEVMDAVQRLRRQAQETGALKDTPQQKVVVEKETIVVEPADPQTVYVPTYDPSVVYGQPPPATQYYPTVYQQPVYTTSTTDPWVSFGAGALVGGLLTAAIMWDDDDDWDGYHVWHHGPGYWDDDWPGPRYGSNNWNNWRGDTNINGDVCIGRCTNIERNEWKRNANNFQHKVEHRGGVKYKDRDKVAARHPEVNRPRQPGGIDRDAARGKQRPTTPPATADRRPGASTRPEARPAQRPETRPAQRPETRPAQRPETRPAQRPETRPAQTEQRTKAPERSVSRAPQPSKSGAFQAGGSSSFDRQASARGSHSRSSSGGFKSSGGGMRGGGGGGGRGGGRGR